MCQKRCEAFVVTNCQFVSCAVDVKLHITCVYEYMRMTYCIYSLYSALFVLYLLYAFRVRRYILNLSFICLQTLSVVFVWCHAVCKPQKKDLWSMLQQPGLPYVDSTTELVYKYKLAGVYRAYSLAHCF